MGQPSFAERWAQKERALGPGNIASVMVEHDGQVLPEGAAPCLNFPEFADQPRLWEVFGTPDQWAESGKKRLGAYRMIGSDGEGCPICIEDGTGKVWLLSPGDNFTTRVLVNSSVPQLGECLLAYLGEKDPSRFREAVQAVDALAAADGTYWPMAADWIVQG
jgi:hypothetical protein